jgi:D-alanine transaminase
VIIHLNGKLMPAELAAISPFDRGFVFGDGVYEGLRSFRGKLVGMDRHIARMREGLKESRIEWDPSPLTRMSEDLIRACAMPDAFIYWQVTRGTPGPTQPVRTRIPAGPMTPTVFGYCSSQPPIENFVNADPSTVTCALCEDTRWTRGRLKSISLLGNVISAIEASEAGAQDAILVKNGLVGEGTAANLILAIGKEVVTPSLDSVPILAGVTRAIELDAAPEIVSRPVRVEELKRASEAMLVGTTTMVTSITSLDGKPVGSGKPGPIARMLLARLTRAIAVDLGFSDVLERFKGQGGQGGDTLSGWTSPVSASR